MKQKRMKYLPILIGALVLVGVIVSFAVESSNVKYKFPMCQEVNEQADIAALIPIINPDVSLRLEGIDFGVVGGNDEYDTIHVVARSKKGTHFGEWYWVDYLSDGKWYTVYRPEGFKEPAWYLGTDDLHLKYTVPSGLFQQKGQYRLYIQSLGFCEIDMLADIE